MSYNSSFLDLALQSSLAASFTSPSATAQTSLRCFGHSVDLCSCRTCRLCKPGQQKEGCLVLSPVSSCSSLSFQFPWFLSGDRAPRFRGLGRAHHPSPSDEPPTTEPEHLNCPRDAYSDFITNPTSQRATCKYKTSLKNTHTHTQKTPPKNKQKKSF